MDTLVAAKARAEKQAQGKPPAGEIHLPVCKVLIIEDDFLLASSLKTTFQKAGAIVLGAVSNKDDAIALLRNDVPDLAVVDLNLGDGVDFDVAEHLQQQSVPFCIYSAYSRLNYPNMPIDLRHVQWLEKPAHPQSVLRAAASALVT
jgi:ActR/RegA family two-component response regulator